MLVILARMLVGAPLLSLPSCPPFHRRLLFWPFIIVPSITITVTTAVVVIIMLCCSLDVYRTLLQYIIGAGCLLAADPGIWTRFFNRSDMPHALRNRGESDSLARLQAVASCD